MTVNGGYSGTIQAVISITIPTAEPEEIIAAKRYYPFAVLLMGWFATSIFACKTATVPLFQGGGSANKPCACRNVGKPGQIFLTQIFCHNDYPKPLLSCHTARGSLMAAGPLFRDRKQAVAIRFDYQRTPRAVYNPRTDKPYGGAI